jgi:serine/threonine protein kinase
MQPVDTLAAIGAPIAVLAIILGAIVAIPVGVLAVIYLFVPFFKGLAWLIRQIGVFIFSTVADSLRLVGAIVTSVVLVPLTIGNVIIGRWSASAHFGRAIQAEFKNMGRCAYRLAIGNPARLLCLTPLTEGIERRIPEVMAAAPGPDRPSRRQGQFPGYQIVGSLPGGGSGGRLYVAKPDAQKLASFARNGDSDVDQVVIKCFSLQEGTTLPQIVRENRALDAAKKLRLILEHDLSNERFFYVMRYVPGDSLNLVTQRLHAAAGNHGLGRPEMQEILSYASDLLATLRTYHDGGLWHKDVKPDNVIVSDGHAHLVDFGLVTPLRSSMTLTTHGTEYFRDPEMVRMALKGVKVHDVDGAKFDLYAVGAVLFSMVENSFPAHGGLSQITRPCPEAVRWIVRRAMTDYDKRYPSAAAMLADIQAVLRASDAFALRPAQLPSVAAIAEPHEPAAAPAMPPPAQPHMPPPIPQPAYASPYPSPAGAPDWSRYPGMNPNTAGRAVGAAGIRPNTDESGRIKPEIRITSWVSGRYTSNGAQPTTPAAGVSTFPGMNAARAAVAQAAVAAASAYPGAARRSPRVHPGARASAAEQIRSARQRAAAARERVRSRRGRSQNFPAGVNAGIVVAVLIFFAFVGFAFFGLFMLRQSPRIVRVGPGPAPIPQPAPTLPVVIDLVRPASAASVGDRAPFTVPAFNAASPEDNRVLVLCEWSKFDEKRQELIASQIEKLDDAGFILVGDFAPAAQSITAAGDVAHDDTIAELLSTVGTRPFLSGVARDAVRSWLDEGHKADVVVWFAGAEPGKPRVPATAWVIGSSSADSGLVGEMEHLLKSAD